MSTSTEHGTGPRGAAPRRTATLGVAGGHGLRALRGLRAAEPRGRARAAAAPRAPAGPAQSRLCGRSPAGKAVSRRDHLGSRERILFCRAEAAGPMPEPGVSELFPQTPCVSRGGPREGAGRPWLAVWVVCGHRAAGSAEKPALSSCFVWFVYKRG